jgi:hypothetical protein
MSRYLVYRWFTDPSDEKLRLLAAAGD